MLKNYLKIAWRNLWQQKLFSLINVLGMALGIGVCFFALTWVRFELSYDSYHDKADRTFRLVTDVKTSAGVEYASSTGAMAPAVRATFPEIEAATSVFLDYLIVQKGQTMASEESIAYADSSLFSVFTLPLLIGDPKTVLTAPLTIVLSETAARRYFGAANPVGETLLINGRERATITGVMKDMPRNSQFRTDIFVSMATLGGQWLNNWKRFFFYTYLVIPATSDPARLSAKITDLVKQHADQQAATYSLGLEPLTSVYLHGKPRGSRTGSVVSGNLSHVYTVALVAVLVLFIACFNFINLTTALSVKRAKETGIRKLMGAARRQLIGHFLLDALLLTSLAFALALLLCHLLTPLVNRLAGKVISTGMFGQGHYVGQLLLLAVVTGLLSGVYPAISLSGFRPLNGLKGQFTTELRGHTLRRMLVIGQFAVSIGLISATIVVYAQLNHMRTHELGFDKEHKIVVDFQFDEQVISHHRAIREQLARVPGVEGVSLSSSLPGRASHEYPTQLENSRHGVQEVVWPAYFVDHDFLAQYQIEIVAGRSFLPGLTTDSTEALLINETAAKKLGYANPADALGKRFGQLRHSGRIVGVVRDFHFRSLQEAVQPLTLRIAPGFFTFLTLDVASKNLPGTISQVQSVWQKLVPDMPFLYSFADEDYDAQYQAEDAFGNLFFCLSIVAVLISCLGLFGLASFVAEQRTKEIGVRKVLGASVGSIVVLLSKDFLKLVLIAIIMVSPLAYYVMHRWLADFAYKITIEWWVFALAGGLAVGIALLTVSFQSIRAALMNPVKSLRSE